MSYETPEALIERLVNDAGYVRTIKALTSVLEIDMVNAPDRVMQLALGAIVGHLKHPIVMRFAADADRIAEHALQAGRTDRPE